MRNSGIRSRKFASAAAAVLLIMASGTAMASPLLNLQVEASTTGVAGSYSSNLSAAPASGSTLFYEVFAQFAASGTTNTNTTKTPNGTTDSLVALPNFTLSATTGTFATSVLQSSFGTGSGASAGTTGTSAIDIRAIELGVTDNADTPLPVVSGTLTVGSTFTGIAASTDIPVVNAGSFKPSGNLVAISSASETSADPILHYSAFTVGTVAPSPIISLSSTAPTAYGSNKGPITISGKNGSYAPGAVTYAAATSAYAQIMSFNPSTDKQIYALDVHDTGNLTADESQIVSDITAAGFTASTSWATISGSSTAPNVLAPLFTDGGTPIYISATGTSATPFLGINFGNDSALSTVTFTGIAAVPEPASVGIFLMTLPLVLARRRRRA